MGAINGILMGVYAVVRDDPYMAFINLIFKWFYSILYMYLAQMG